MWKKTGNKGYYVTNLVFILKRGNEKVILDTHTLLGRYLFCSLFLLAILKIFISYLMICLLGSEIVFPDFFAFAVKGVRLNRVTK